MSPRPSKRSPDATDILIGARVRVLRLARGMSQTALAEAVGVSFQQVQKYEKGVNRIGGGRLTRLAAALGVSTTEMLGEAATDGGSPTDELAQYVQDKRAFELLAAFYRLDGASKTAVVNLVVAMVDKKR